MPAATTHVIFAQDVKQHLDPQISKQIIDDPMFLLGSQGPDLLFFSRGSLLPGSLNKYGSILHHEKQELFLPFFDRYTENDPELRSYFYGFLCHYALDSTTHPLISAAAKIASDETGGDMGIYHVEMEGEIDIWILNQRGRTAESYDVYRHLKIKPSQRKKIGRMYHEMFLEIFNLDFPEKTFADCCWETAFFTRVLSPAEWKYKLFYRLEDLIGYKHRFSAMMLNFKSYSGVLNLEKKELPIPWEPTASIHASFPELYGKSITLAERLIKGCSPEDFVLDFGGRKSE